jgi:hypothetical protein
MHKYLFALTFLLFGAPPQAQAQIDSHPTFEACGYESSFTSTDGAAQSVTFEAGTNLSTAVNIHWINHNGSTEFYQNLWPGMSVNISTFTGHGWVGILEEGCAYVEVYQGLQRVVFAFDDY